MSLFDSASLVVTPNGYKEDKLYSIKPTDGSGDLVVTRATTATRVNSAGLVELVPYNLLQYSEQLNDSVWTKLNVTISANSVTAPNGTLTADTLTNSSTGYGLWQTLDVIAGATYTFSFYVKKGTNTSYILSVIDASAFTSITSLDYSAQTSSTEWVRIEKTFTIPSGTSTIRVYPMRDGSSTGTAFLWGMQLVTGTSAKEYFPTTDRLNVPRIDYTNGSCPSILVEPQRTNLLTYSEQFDNAAWLKLGISITANNTTSPDGTATADLVTTTNATSHELAQAKPLIGTHTCSFYVKKNNSQTFYIALFPNGFASYFNLNNGTVSSVVGIGVSANITNAGNGWYRCSITFTNVGSEVQLGFLDTVYTGGAGNPWTISTSVGTSGWVWGAQLEAGSYATSYIPTVASSVTRNADVISKTGISSLIGQTEGTIFVDFYRNSQAESIGIMLANALGTNSYMNSIYLFQVANNLLTCDCFVSNSQQFSLQLAGGLSNGRHKIALAYKQNDAVLYVDGVQIDTDTSCNIPPMTSIDISQEFAASNYKNNTTALWKTRLTNAELATLTTI
jgi:hypothetical protein